MNIAVGRPSLAATHEVGGRGRPPHEAIPAFN